MASPLVPLVVGSTRGVSFITPPTFPLEAGRHSRFFYDPAWTDLMYLDANAAHISDADWRPNCSTYVTGSFRPDRSIPAKTPAAPHIPRRQRKATMAPSDATQ